MAQANCETCMNYEYDEECDYYVCTKDLDEDEMVRFYPGRVQGLPLLSVRRRISDCKKTDLMRKYLYLRRSSLKKSVIRQEHSSPRIPVSTFT